MFANVYAMVANSKQLMVVVGGGGDGGWKKIKTNQWLSLITFQSIQKTLLLGNVIHPIYNNIIQLLSLCVLPVNCFMCQHSLFRNSILFCCSCSILRCAVILCDYCQVDIIGSSIMNNAIRLRKHYYRVDNIVHCVLLFANKKKF